jgi:hypothetical protein
VVALASSFAIWMQLEQLAVNLLPRHLNAFPDLSASSEWMLLGLYLRPDRLLVAALGVVLTLALAHWLQHSRGGLAWRAAATQRTAAALVGISVARVQAVAFLLACALSGVAAFALLSLDGQVTPMFGMWMLTKGLVAAVLGGLGRVRGVLMGGWMLGVVEAHAQDAFGAVGREFSTYALLFVVLVASRANRPGLALDDRRPVALVSEPAPVASTLTGRLGAGGGRHRRRERRRRPGRLAGVTILFAAVAVAAYPCQRSTAPRRTSSRGNDTGDSDARAIGTKTRPGIQD